MGVVIISAEDEESINKIRLYLRQKVTRISTYPASVGNREIVTAITERSPSELLDIITANVPDAKGVAVE